MTERDPIAPDPGLTRAFARKVQLSTWALFFERLWPRLWLLIGVLAAFAALSLLGVWPSLSTLAHRAGLAAFTMAALAAAVYAARAPWPTRVEAVRRIERRSGVAHRPASSYEDQLTAQTSSPETAALWQAHRQRLSRAIERLKVGNPSPRADRFDPFAVRSLALLALIPAAMLVTGTFSDRLASAFRFGGGDARPGSRVDAWVTPPPYTAVPPVLLADGSDIVTKPDDKPKLFEVPERSLLTLRGTGFGKSGVSLEVLSVESPETVKVESDPPKAGDTSGLAEIRYELKKSSRIRALSGGAELARWTFNVIPDQLPKITLDTKALDRTPRGSMKLSYKAEDDYGVASATAKLRQVRPKDVDPKKAWAHAAPLKGARLPLERPPILALKIPRAGAKTVEGSTLLELGSHPWAGQKVELWLEATDVGGQIGKSAAVEMVLPARRFKKPLARAVIEQRRKLSEDSRNRPAVARALTALTLEPEGFIETNGIYLGLRSVYHRLEREGTRASINESIEQLWHLALNIEDGALSDAERALKEAQDKLAEALEKGADDKEIDRLIAEMKQKLADYLKEMQKNAQKDDPGGDKSEQSDEQSQEVGERDFEAMLKELEQSAKEGSREEAQKTLDNLREMMDRLQAETKESRAENQKAKEMMKKLGQLDGLANKQKQLMDDTFAEQKKQEGSMEGGEQEDGSGQESQNDQQGKQGKQGKGSQKSQKDAKSDQEGGSQQGEGQQGEDGNKPGQRQKGGKADKGDLKERQAQLKKQLDQLKKDLDQMGAGDPDKLDKAGEAMEKAEDALGKKDMEEAAEEQGEAIEQMRQSAKQMAEQMQKNAQQKMGRGGDTPRDPLGRPQKSQGPDLGTSVKVPDAIDAQRAREILDELRKRSSESLRPPSELDYIDRLLKRF
jgi:uncharacterized protein (TIGR02302 family)